MEDLDVVVRSRVSRMLLRDFRCERDRTSESHDKQSYSVKKGFSTFLGTTPAVSLLVCWNLLAQFVPSDSIDLSLLPGLCVRLVISVYSFVVPDMVPRS